jgi:hypothetical protein
MSEKLKLAEVLAAVDMDAKDLWDALDDFQRTELTKDFFTLNRWVSATRSNDIELMYHYVVVLNDRYNLNWAEISKHPKLQWMLLCSCSHDLAEPNNHEWIPLQKKANDKNTKIVTFLANIYPTMKMDEVELLAKIMSKHDIAELATAHAYDPSQIKKIIT